jgi:hypothetical protein
MDALSCPCLFLPRQAWEEKAGGGTARNFTLPRQARQAGEGMDMTLSLKGEGF